MSDDTSSDGEGSPTRASALTPLYTDVPTSVSELPSEDAQLALQYAKSKPDRVGEIVMELLANGADTIARRVASCSNAGNDCGKYSLCEQCSPGGYVQRKYGQQALEWERPTYFWVKHNRLYDDPADARQAILGGFNSETFLRRHFPLDEDWLKQLAKKDREFANRLRAEYFDEGLSVPFKELITAGIAGVHVETHRGRYYAHIDCFCNSRYIPWETLADVWDTCVPGHGTAGISRLVVHEGDVHEDAVLKTLAYVTETVDIDDVGDLVSYALDTENKPTYLTWGLSDN